MIGFVIFFLCRWWLGGGCRLVFLLFRVLRLLVIENISLVNLGKKMDILDRYRVVFRIGEGIELISFLG